MAGGELPPDDPTPVMADEKAALDPERIEDLIASATSLSML